MRAKILLSGMLAAVFALSGCSAEIPHSGPLTDAEITEWNVTMLSGTWKALGIPEPAPDPAWADASSLDFATWLTDVEACLTQADLAQHSPGFAVGIGYFYDETKELDVDQRRSWYECLARNQIDPAQMGFRSPRQLDYAYEYYQSWLVPCLEERGLDIAVIPTRAEFRAEGGWWSPYAVSVPQLTDYQRQDYVKVCGEDLSRLNPVTTQG